MAERTFSGGGGTSAPWAWDSDASPSPPAAVAAGAVAATGAGGRGGTRGGAECEEAPARLRMPAATSAAKPATTSPNGQFLATAAGSAYSPSSNTAKNASWGTSIRPTCFMRRLPAFCFSSSLRLRLMSPP